mgnify:CR=1 FL=1
MTEGLAGATGVPGDALNRLYGIWSDGGAGLLLSGNVQIDRDALPVQDEKSAEFYKIRIEKLKRLTRAGGRLLPALAGLLKL